MGSGRCLCVDKLIRNGGDRDCANIHIDPRSDIHVGDVPACRRYGRMDRCTSLCAARWGRVRELGTMQTETQRDKAGAQEEGSRASW